MIKLSHNDGMN